MSIHTKILRLKNLKLQKELITVLQKYGTPKHLIEEVPIELATRKPQEGNTYWYYSGPLDNKTRPFCKRMLQIDKVFSDEEIGRISEELGYDVLAYAGVTFFNCRHKWIRFRGKFISTPAPTVREIRKLINDGIPVD